MYISRRAEECLARPRHPREKTADREMAYYAHTHKADKIASKNLFRLNGISYEEMLENLCILLDDEINESTSTVANLPTNKDTIKVLKDVIPSAEISSKSIQNQ